MDVYQQHIPKACVERCERCGWLCEFYSCVIRSCTPEFHYLLICNILSTTPFKWWSKKSTKTSSGLPGKFCHRSSSTMYMGVPKHKQPTSYSEFGSITEDGLQYSRFPFQWRHNGYDGVSNHQPPHCLPKRSFRNTSKKTSKLRVTGLCAGNSPVTGEVPANMASNAENVFIWWSQQAYVPIAI